MIKNIVFDLGRVLMEFDTHRYAELSGVKEEDMELFRNEVYRSPEWLRLERGRHSEEDAIDVMCGRLPHRLHAPVEDAVLRWWHYPILPVEGMAKVVEDLKQRGFGIYILSNARKSAYKYMERIPGCSCADGCVLSSDVGFLKPEHEIYEALLRKYGLEAEECLFIDDVTANIEAAMNCGMKGIVFRGNAQWLREKLRDFGIDI